MATRRVNAAARPGPLHRLDEDGVGLKPGAPDPARSAGRPDAVAQDGDGRVLFRITEATLWWDADGRGRAGPVLLADLPGRAAPTAGASS